MQDNQREFFKRLAALCDEFEIQIGRTAQGGWSKLFSVRTRCGHFMHIDQKIKQNKIHFTVKDLSITEEICQD